MSNQESEKYRRMWEREEYRRVAPGEFFARAFLEHAKPKPGSHVIDFGCGTGRGGAVLATLGGLKVTMIDLVDNCLDDHVRPVLGPNLEFIQADLEKPIPAVAEYGFCSDTMEHIPPDKVDVVLNNILRAAQSVWFSIALVEDSCGVLIGETLHLSVHPFEWWKKKFEERDCQIIYSHNQDDVYAHFYVNAWQTGQAVVEHGLLNTEEEQIIKNVRHNIAQDWRQIMPRYTNDMEVMIVGGGPSLALFEDEIRQNKRNGIILVTLNGAYNWCIERDIVPSMQIVVDARPFNARFTKPVLPTTWKIVDQENNFLHEFTTQEEAQEQMELLSRPGLRLYEAGTKFLIASQVDPSTLEGLPKDRTFLWHTMAEQIHDILDTQYGQGQWSPVPGGSTVLLRSFPLLRTLGYRKFILYGCDSCLAEDGRHHSYEQAENDKEYKIPVVLNPSGKIFWGHLWMFSQAEEFISTIRYLGDEIELDVKGDGLLANILKVGADLADIEELKVCRSGGY